MITYENRPSWNQAFRGATHILRMRKVFRYFFATEMGHGDFENIAGETLNDFVVIEKKPSNGPVTIANTFLEKPDWSLAFVGATHIISVNNIGLQKITYHFAKKTGEQFTNSVGTPFTNVTVVEDGPGDGMTNLKPGRLSFKIPMVVPPIITDETLFSRVITVTPVETTNHRTEQIRNKLTKFIDYDEGKVLRNELHEYAKKSYVRKFSSDQYLKFMNANECDFTINGAQSTNHPHYFTLFTVVSQHVMGDCVEECLDKAIYILKGEK